MFAVQSERWCVMEMFSIQVKEKLALLAAKEEEVRALRRLYLGSVTEIKRISDEILDSCGEVFVVEGICYKRSIQDFLELNALPRTVGTYRQSDTVKVFQ